jgi:hypothetical protein
MQTQADKLDKEWKLKYYSQLKGATILNVEVFEDDLYSGFDANWPVFIIKLADGSTTELQLSSDEEGNAPGFMFGLPRV